MSDDTHITRTVETELDVDELWSLVADGDRWGEWMVDGADISVDPGARGTVVDDGVARGVRIDRVEHVEQTGRVAFTWWPEVRPDEASTVELVVAPARVGSRLRVIETYVGAGGLATNALAWDVRAMLLTARAVAVRA